MENLLFQDFYKVAEIELVYRSKVKANDRVKVVTAHEAYRVFMRHWDDNKIDLVEQVKMILLDTANRCLGIVDIGLGGMDLCIVDPRIVFAAALKGKASGIILAHNHPSGNLKPSRSDTMLTNKLVEAGKLLDLRLLDHLIVTSEGYYSFGNDGTLGLGLG